MDRTTVVTIAVIALVVAVGAFSGPPSSATSDAFPPLLMLAGKVATLLFLVGLARALQRRYWPEVPPKVGQ